MPWLRLAVFFTITLVSAALFNLPAGSQQQQPTGDPKDGARSNGTAKPNDGQVRTTQGAPMPEPKPPVPAVNPNNPNEIIQEFPTNDIAKTAWKIRWSTTRGPGLTIQDAWFRRAPNEPFFQVLGDVRLAEMFVPYHSGSPRFWDIAYNFSLIPVGRDEAGPFGKVLGNPPNVVAELRDRGVMFMDIPRGTRRGQVLVLWGIIDAANYRYIVEYGFQDDGVVTCRVGSTGRNYSSREFQGHMHLGLWRVDVNLEGPESNSVYLMEHIEPDPEHPERARTETRPFNGGREGYEDWKANNFTMLSIISHKSKNVRGKPYSYDVMVPRMGIARHHGADDEQCTHHDYWVTKNRPKEMDYRKVNHYVRKDESIMESDVVLWLSTACHHEPRSEDGEFQGKSFRGATLVAWSGFELRPRNVFDRTPHYNYPPPKK